MNWWKIIIPSQYPTEYKIKIVYITHIFKSLFVIPFHVKKMLNRNLISHHVQVRYTNMQATLAATVLLACWIKYCWFLWLLLLTRYFVVPRFPTQRNESIANSAAIFLMHYFDSIVPKPTLLSYFSSYVAWSTGTPRKIN